MSVTIGRNYTILRFWSQHKNSSKSAVPGLAGHADLTILLIYSFIIAFVQFAFVQTLPLNPAACGLTLTLHPSSCGEMPPCNSITETVVWVRFIWISRVLLTLMTLWLTPCLFIDKQG